MNNSTDDIIEAIEEYFRIYYLMACPKEHQPDPVVWAQGLLDQEAHIKNLIYQYRARELNQ